MLFSPWRAGFFRDSYACVSRHFYDFSDHRREASVLRTSALSSRTCTYMQGQQFSLMLAVRRRTGKCGAQHLVSFDGDRSILLEHEHLKNIHILR